MGSDVDTARVRPFGRLPANRSGLGEALLGYGVGVVLGSILFAVAVAAGADRHTGGFAADVSGLVGLWIGFVGAAVVAFRRNGFGPRPTRAALREAFGVAIRPIDVPVGIVAGLAAQYLLVPVFEAPLLPFVPHLGTRLSGPANALTKGVTTPGLVILGVLVCVGSPLFEELVFRGVLLRGLAGARRGAGLATPRTATLAVLIAAVLFGLAHFEALQLPGLIGAGLVFGALASTTGRLGPGFIAHVTFNTATFVAVVHLL